jgi:coenzyme F420 hydrogenase subunit beta
MKNLTVMKTKKLDLCVSCEICLAVCPENAIKMEYSSGQFLPIVDNKKCSLCRLCLELCPGIEIDPLKLRFKKTSDSVLKGNCIESYTAFSNDPKIRKNSISGGLITNLITQLISSNEFDAAFVLNFEIFKGKPARLKAKNKIFDIIKAAKSKYVPVSVYNVIKKLQNDNKRYIIVGTPCQICGIKKLIQKFQISDEKLLFLGLFCDRTLNFNLIRFFEDNYKKSNEKLIRFDFRTKEMFGWPGFTKLSFTSGRELFVDRKVRIQLKRYFTLNRCLFCYDKLNRKADISFGDCYIRGKEDFDGRSSVIIRTRKGKDVFEKVSDLFTKEKELIERIRKSQNLRSRKNNLEYVKLFIKKYNLYNDSLTDYEINSNAEKTLSKFQMDILWGKNYSFKNIKFALFLFLRKSNFLTIGKSILNRVNLSSNESLMRGIEKILTKSPI